MKFTPEHLADIMARPGYAMAKSLATVAPTPVPTAKITRNRKVKGLPSSEPTESVSQQRIMRWWDTAYQSYGFTDRRVLMAFPLQGARTPRNGARMKAEGLRAGTPDMLLAVPRNGSHGLWIELKTSKGKPSALQSTFLDTMRSQGYAAIVCHSAALAVNAIQIYLGQPLRAEVPKFA